MKGLNFVVAGALGAVIFAQMESPLVSLSELWPRIGVIVSFTIFGVGIGRLSV